MVGVLFSSQNITRDETELLVLVTPELVHPQEPDSVPQLVPVFLLGVACKQPPK